MRWLRCRGVRDGGGQATPWVLGSVKHWSFGVWAEGYYIAPNRYLYHSEMYLRYMIL